MTCNTNCGKEATGLTYRPISPPLILAVPALFAHSHVTAYFVNCSETDPSRSVPDPDAEPLRSPGPNDSAAVTHMSALLDSGGTDAFPEIALSGAPMPLPIP